MSWQESFGFSSPLVIHEAPQQQVVVKGEEVVSYGEIAGVALGQLEPEMSTFKLKLVRQASGIIVVIGSYYMESASSFEATLRRAEVSEALSGTFNGRLITSRLAKMLLPFIHIEDGIENCRKVTAITYSELGICALECLAYTPASQLRVTSGGKDGRVDFKLTGVILTNESPKLDEGPVRFGIAVKHTFEQKFPALCPLLRDEYAHFLQPNDRLDWTKSLSDPRNLDLKFKHPYDERRDNLLLEVPWHLHVQCCQSGRSNDDLKQVLVHWWDNEEAVMDEDLEYALERGNIDEILENDKPIDETYEESVMAPTSTTVSPVKRTAADANLNQDLFMAPQSTSASPVRRTTAEAIFDENNAVVTRPNAISPVETIAAEAILDENTGKLCIKLNKGQRASATPPFAAPTSPPDEQRETPVKVRYQHKPKVVPASKFKTVKHLPKGVTEEAIRAACQGNGLAVSLFRRKELQDYLHYHGQDVVTINGKTQKGGPQGLEELVRKFVKEREEHESGASG